jgi:hypothetical protein
MWHGALSSSQMAGQRLTACVVVLAISAATLPICAEGEIGILTDVRPEVEAYRHARAVLSIELTDGTLLTGSVGAVRKNGFVIVTGLHAKQSVGYANVQAFVDPETGQTLALVHQAPPTGSVGGRRATLLAVIVAAAAVATVYLVVYVLYPRT